MKRGSLLLVEFHLQMVLHPIRVRILQTHSDKNEKFILNKKPIY